jgi:hypothetical protein
VTLGGDRRRGRQCLDLALLGSVSGPATSPIWFVTVPKVQPLLPGVNEYTRPAAPYNDEPIDSRPVVGVPPFDPSNDAIVVGPVVEPRIDRRPFCIPPESTLAVWACGVEFANCVDAPHAASTNTGHATAIHAALD